MRLLAVSVDAPEDSRRVVDTFELPFPILADVDRAVVHDFGVVHEAAGPGGSDIALPSLWLIMSDGRVVWQRVADKVMDRPPPEEVLAIVKEKLGS